MGSSSSDATVERRRRSRKPRSRAAADAPDSGWHTRGIPAVLLCVGVALGVRLWALRYQPYPAGDSTLYIQIAESFLDGRALPSVFPPGYPLLIALARLVISHRLLAAVSISVACGALLPWPVWALARNAVGPRWALLPAMAVALQPELAQVSALAMSEAPYFLALFGALALTRRSFASGLLLGVAYSIRPEALLPAALLGAWKLFHPGPDRRQALRSAALFAAGFLALALPCWMYFHATLGQWTLSPKLTALHAPAGWRVLERSLIEPSANAAARPESGLVVRLSSQRAEQVVYQLLLIWPWPLLALSLTGLVFRRGPEALPLAHLAVLPALGVPSIESRFLMSALPSLAILASIPCARIARQGRRGWLSLAGGAVFSVAWIAGFAGVFQINARWFTRPAEGEVGPEKRAGEWLAGVARPGEAIMERKPFLAFYARLPYVVTPDFPYDSLLDYAVTRKVRYLAVSEVEARVVRPQLGKVFYHPEFMPRESRLDPLYVCSVRGADCVVLFRVLQPGEPKSGLPPMIDRFADLEQLSRASPP